jgi:predicted phosphodiesterase
MDPEPSRTNRAAVILRRLGGGLALAVLAYLSGVSMTTIWPATADTPIYHAEVSLQAWPSSRLDAQTVLGDVRVEFDGPVPAPGITVAPQVKREVTNVLANQGVSAESLRPTDAQIRNAVASALQGLAWRFALGAVLGVVLVIGLLWIGRPGRRTALAQVGATAAVLALAVPTLAGWQTYRVSNVGTIQTTSLLGMVRSNAGMFTDVRNRSQQVSRYVVNTLALTESLQRTLVPPGGSSPAVRILLVSDIHGVDQFPIIKRLIEEEGIDAVIDSGDLINFGRVQEADAAGIFDGIKSLGVPYVFVGGNHDASGPGDESLLRRLAQVPNVVLAEPTRKEYRQLDLGGLTIGGFNDPRYYGDSDEDANNEQPQKNRQRDFLNAYGGEPPDIVVSHEPAAVEGIAGPSRLLINGHVHTPARDDRRVSVGTFTGGGVFGGRVAKDAPPGTEKLTSTYSFDVAQFGTSCGLISLTRYAFKDIVEGRPAYQDLSIINGRSIVETPKDRTCTAGAKPKITTVK